MDMVFEIMYFWVRVYDIFFGIRERESIKFIVVRVGKLVEYIEDIGFRWEVLIRFRVVLDIEKFFWRGLKVMGDGGGIK